MTQAYPLHWPEGWPRTPVNKRRRNYQFRTDFSRARGDLLDELRLLNARSIVISSNLRLRLDGLPYADEARRRIDDPGVAVYFTMKEKPMVMARDAYETVHENMRSISLAVSHLRGLERHGGGSMMERAFSGFAALPSPETVTQRSWRQVLGLGDIATVTLDSAEYVYRDLAKRIHPDAPGGSAVLMAELNAAIQQARKELSA